MNSRDGTGGYSYTLEDKHLSNACYTEQHVIWNDKDHRLQPYRFIIVQPKITELVANDKQRISLRVIQP